MMLKNCLLAAAMAFTAAPALAADYTLAVEPNEVRLTLLDESLWQLRAAWQQLDGRAHVNRFLSLPQLQDAMAAGGFTAPRLESLTWSLAYPELSGLLRALKGIGASQINDERQPGLSSRQRLQPDIAAQQAALVQLEPGTDNAVDARH